MEYSRRRKSRYGIHLHYISLNVSHDFITESNLFKHNTGIISTFQFFVKSNKCIAIGSSVLLSKTKKKPQNFVNVFVPRFCSEKGDLFFEAQLSKFSYPFCDFLHYLSPLSFGISLL